MAYFKIELRNYRCFTEDQPLILEFKGGITAIVGPNNSGKSSALKWLYELRNFLSLCCNGGNLAQLAGNGIQTKLPVEVFDSEEVFNHTNTRDISITIIPLQSVDEDPPNSKSWARLWINRHLILRLEVPAHAGNVGHGGVSIGSTGTSLIVNEIPFDLSWFLDACTILSSTLYIGSFRNPIAVGGGNYYDLSIGVNFIKDWDNRQNGAKQSDSKAIDQITETIKNIFGFESLSINATVEKLKTLRVSINGHPFKLPELGSGIAEFIMVLGNVAIRKPEYVLIDEPENHLHPKLQLDFVTSLAALARSGMIFTTHSAGLARAASDQIKVVTMESAGKSKCTDAFDSGHSLSDIASEMSFSTWNDIGCKRILLVEGQTDIKVFQQWLRLYRKDHDTVIIQLGGRSMIHADRKEELNELTRLGPSVCCIIDSERSSEKEPLSNDRQEFLAAAAAADVVAVSTSLRATENYFPLRAVQEELGSTQAALEPYESLTTAKSKWPKHRNWRIASKMTKSEIADTDIGLFIEKM